VQDAWKLRSRHVYEEVADLQRRIAPTQSATARDFLEQARVLLATYHEQGALSVEHHLERLGEPSGREPGRGGVGFDAGT
jgi:hypothetical protein